MWQHCENNPAYAHTALYIRELTGLSRGSKAVRLNLLLSGDLLLGVTWSGLFDSFGGGALSLSRRVVFPFFKFTEVIPPLPSAWIVS